MPGVSFVNRGADDHRPAEPGEELVRLLWGPVPLRQSDVEKSFLGDLLVGAWRVHRRRSQRPHKGWRLLQNRRNRRRNRHDAVLRDEIAQSSEGIAKGLEQTLAGGMIA